MANAWMPAGINKRRASYTSRCRATRGQPANCALVMRTQGIYFIMVTMAFAQMVFFLFFDNKALGGSDGIYVNV